MLYIFEILLRFLQFDLAWFAHFILANVFWIFAFAATGFYFFPKKNLFTGFILVIFAVFVALDFTNLSGWGILSATFLAFHYLFRMALLMFTESIESLKPYFPLILGLQLVAAMIIYNLFLVNII